MLTEHLLHLVALTRAYIIIIKVNHVRLPVAVSVLTQERSIGCHFYHIAVALHIAEVDALSQRIVYRIGTARCIFAQINLRSLAVVMVVIILMVQEPARLLIIMLVYGINPALVFAGNLPTLNIIGRREVERRRAMSKKKQAVMEKERQSFVYGNREEGVKGCIKNGISEEIANKIYDEMIDFAKYAFNKSHAAAYGVVAYQTAYLKYYYAAEFMAAMLTSVMDISTKVAEYVYSCRSMGIEILPPDINEGESGFSAKGNSIRYGLTAIKNVGKNIIDGIVEEREKHGKYTDLEDFITRTANLGVNKRAIENFIKAGAFDSLNATRKQMMMVYIQILDGVNKENKDAWEGQMSIFDMADDSTKEKYKVKMPDVGEYTVDQKLAFEKEVIGIYASGHPLQAQEQKWRKHITNMSIDFTEPEEGEESKVPDKSKVAVGGIISAITKKFTKTGQQMAFITLEDLVGTVEVVVFPRQFERSRMLMEEGQKIFVKGEANIEENSAGKVLANSIVSFDQVPSELWIAFKDKEEYMAKEKELLETLLLHKGGDKVMIALAKERQQKALPIEYRVDANNQFIEELKKTYGQDFVKLRV